MKTRDRDSDKTMLQLTFVMFLIFLIVVIFTSHTSFPPPSQKQNAGRFSGPRVRSEATQLQVFIPLTIICAYSLYTTLV